MRFKLDQFVIDGDRRTVTRGDHEVHVAPKTLDILLVLLGRAPRSLWLPRYFLAWFTTFMAVVIIDATSDRLDGRMIVSALLITLPNSWMYCSATFN